MSSEEEEKSSKIRKIVNRVFQEELLERERMAFKIEDDIAKTKELLHKLRYAIVTNYYMPCSSGTVETGLSSDIISSGIRDSDQKPIHPSLKKLIGKRPLDEILLGSRTTRKAALEPQGEMKAVKISQKRSQEVIKCVQVQQQSPIIQLTSSRGRDQLRHLIVVGNTSQFLNEQPNLEPNSKITHKWMCYLKTKSEVPIERLVAKVRFYLDPSYKPNDVIDVSSPPFSITKRGYGEFPIQLLIFFKDEVQMKPFKIFHKLILDKKLTGHQTLGNETISELWTRNFTDESSVESSSSYLCDNRNHLIDHDYLKASETSQSVEGKKETLECLHDEEKNVNDEAVNVDLIEDPETRNVIEWIERNFPTIPTNVVTSFDVSVENDENEQETTISV